MPSKTSPRWFFIPFFYTVESGSHGQPEPKTEQKPLVLIDTLKLQNEFTMLFLSGNIMVVKIFLHGILV